MNMPMYIAFESFNSWVLTRRRFVGLLPLRLSDTYDTPVPYN